MRKEIADPRGRSFVFVWQVVAVETVKRPEHRSLIGRTVWDYRAGEQARDPLDTFLDLSLADDLEMQFVLAAPPNRKRQSVTETLIKSPLVMAGSSDGGAHLLSFCGADYTTRLLSEWTPDVLPIEDAIDVGSRASRRPRTGSPIAARSSRARPPTCCSSTGSIFPRVTPRATCATSRPTAVGMSWTRPGTTP